VEIEVTERADGRVLAMCTSRKEKEKLPASTTHSDASGYGVTYLYGLQLSTGSLLFNLLHGTYDVLPGKQTSGGDASSLHLFSKQRDRTTKARAPAPCVRTCGLSPRPFTLTFLRVRGDGLLPESSPCEWSGRIMNGIG
jgi:hypothetical protein